MIEFWKSRWMVCALLSLTLAPVRAHAVAELPSRFVDETVRDGFSKPVDLALLPDGRMLVAEQKLGTILVLSPDGTQQAATALTVPNLDIAHNEAGLLAVAVDPGWPTRPYIYTWYDAATPNEIRLTRFTATFGHDDPEVDLLFSQVSALHLLEGVPDNAGNHNGGTLRFGLDGMLYASTGDDESRCSAQVPNDFRGKILRLDAGAIGDVSSVTRAQLVATGNPYIGQGDIASLVWTIGLRNPFRFTIDDLNGALLIADVGQSQREEISLVAQPELNLGWPFREGNLVFTTGGCTEPPGFVSLAPIIDYGRTEGSSVIAGVVYRAPADAVNAWPAQYEGDFFYVDHYQGKLWRLQGSDQSWSIAPDLPSAPEPGYWATNMRGSTDFEIASDGSVLWVSLWEGRVGRIRYLGPLSQEQTSFGSLKSRYE